MRSVLVWEKEEHTGQWLVEEVERERDHGEEQVNGSIAQFLKVYHPPECVRMCLCV